MASTSSRTQPVGQQCEAVFGVVPGELGVGGLEQAQSSGRYGRGGGEYGGHGREAWQATVGAGKCRTSHRLISENDISTGRGAEQLGGGGELPTGRQLRAAELHRLRVRLDPAWISYLEPAVAPRSARVRAGAQPAVAAWRPRAGSTWGCRFLPLGLRRRDRARLCALCRRRHGCATARADLAAGPVDGGSPGPRRALPYLVELAGQPEADARRRSEQLLGVLLDVFVAGPFGASQDARPPRSRPWWKRSESSGKRV